MVWVKFTSDFDFSPAARKGLVTVAYKAGVTENVTRECADKAIAAGINAEIVPGILPISNVAQTRKFAAMCGAAIPVWMDRLFDGLDDHPATRQLVAATVAAELCRRLYAGGVRHFHFYTLNRAELSYAICHLLGVRAK